MYKKNKILLLALSCSSLIAEPTSLSQICPDSGGSQSICTEPAEGYSGQIFLDSTQIQSICQEPINASSPFSATQPQVNDEQKPVKSERIENFSIDQVLDCAHASDLIYKIKEKSDKVPSLVSALGLKSYEVLRNNSYDVVAFVGEKSDGSVFVSFAGTTSFVNGLVDIWANYAFDRDRNGFYHNGIFKAYKILEVSIQYALEKIAKNREISFSDLLNNVYFTGHSLGGGMAIVAADIYRRKGYLSKGVVTFAAPRVMDALAVKEFNSSMQDRALIVKQVADLFTVILPSVFGWKQVGNQLLIPFCMELWPHKLAGYICALEEFKKHGHINADGKAFGAWNYIFKTLFSSKESLDPEKTIFKFEKDPYMNNSLSDTFRTLYSPTFRFVHRHLRLPVEGFWDLAYEKDLMINAGWWTLENSARASLFVLKKTFLSSVWVYNAYQASYDPSVPDHAIKRDFVRNVEYTAGEIKDGLSEAASTVCHAVAYGAGRFLNWLKDKESEIGIASWKDIKIIFNLDEAVDAADYVISTTNTNVFKKIGAACSYVADSATSALSQGVSRLWKAVKYPFQA